MLLALKPQGMGTNRDSSKGQYRQVGTEQHDILIRFAIICYWSVEGQMCREQRPYKMDFYEWGRTSQHRLCYYLPDVALELLPIFVSSDCSSFSVTQEAFWMISTHVSSGLWNMLVINKEFLPGEPSWLPFPVIIIKQSNILFLLDKVDNNTDTSSVTDWKYLNTFRGHWSPI